MNSPNLQQFKNSFWGLIFFWLAVCLSIHLWLRLSGIEMIANLSPLYTAFVLLYLPQIIYEDVKDFFYSLEKKINSIFSSLKILLIFSAVIFPFFFLLNHFFQLYFLGHAFKALPWWAFNKTEIYWVFLNNVLLVALPEEYFFRVFLWDKFKKHISDSSSLKLFQVPLSKLFFFNAFIFALSHSLIVLQWWHFAIFFPAMAFIWLRLKTQGLLAPLLFHACCNVATYWIGLNYR